MQLVAAVEQVMVLVKLSPTTVVVVPLASTVKVNGGKVPLVIGPLGVGTGVGLGVATGVGRAVGRGLAVGLGFWATGVGVDECFGTGTVLVVGLGVVAGFGVDLGVAFGVGVATTTGELVGCANRIGTREYPETASLGATGTTGLAPGALSTAKAVPPALSSASTTIAVPHLLTLMAG